MVSLLVLVGVTVTIALTAMESQKRIESVKPRHPDPVVSPVPATAARTDYVWRTTFTERRKGVRQACKRRGGPATLTPAQSLNLYRHMIVDDNHKLIYCYVPKAACTSWKKVMLVLAGHVQSVHVGKARAPHTRSHHKMMSDLSESERKKRLRTYTKFMVYREPFSRLLSAYIDKFTDDNELRKKYGPRIIAMYRENPSKQSLRSGNVNFVEFIRFVVYRAESISSFNINEHWQSQVSLCQPCVVDYDYYSEMQTVGQDAEAILQSIGAESVEFPQSHVTKSSINMTQFYSDIDPRLIRKYVKLFKKDFDIFGYSKSF
jgi:hypothetical protein